MTDKIFMTAKELKEGRYVIIEDIPCKIVNIESSKPGKHGAAKMRVTGINIFGGEKKTLLTPSDADVEVPLVERKNAQIVSISGKTASVMDSRTYEMYDIEIPEEYITQAAAGKEMEILESMGKRKVERVR